MDIREAKRMLAIRWYHSKKMIRRRYAVQVRETHPDRGGDPERLLMVREAYQVLVQRAKPVLQQMLLLPGAHATPRLPVSRKQRYLPLPRSRPAERPFPLLRRALWQAVRRGEGVEGLLLELGRLCRDRHDLLPRATAYVRILPFPGTAEERIQRRQGAEALVRQVASAKELPRE